MAPDFPMVGNLLWLDFLNTAPVRDGERVDLLAGYGELLAFLQQASALQAGEARRAARWAGTVEASAVMREATALRAALRAGADRMVEGRSPGEAMARVVNRVLASRPTYAELVREGAAWVTRSRPVAASPRHLLVPIAESAAWLLEHGDPSLVRRCDGPSCVLFFYDTTKNRSRRWCSMESCGSRVKAAAYYRRTRGG